VASPNGVQRCTHNAEEVTNIAPLFANAFEERQSVGESCLRIEVQQKFAGSCYQSPGQAQQSGNPLKADD